MRDAHRLLDEVAKEQCGRDGLACRVWKRGGPVLTWAQPWGRALDVKSPRGDGSVLTTLVDEVCYLFQDEQDESARFSSKFFYKMRDLFELVAPGGTPSLDDQSTKQILMTEYLSNRNLAWPDDLSTEEKRKKAEHRVDRLLALCQQQKRDSMGVIYTDPNGLSADGALLVRFLAQKEV